MAQEDVLVSGTRVSEYQSIGRYFQCSFLSTVSSDKFGPVGYVFFPLKEFVWSGVPLLVPRYHEAFVGLMMGRIWSFSYLAAVIPICIEIHMNF